MHKNLNKLFHSALVLFWFSCAMVFIPDFFNENFMLCSFLLLHLICCLDIPAGLSFGHAAFLGGAGYISRLCDS
jgi:hypothetical protein